ncbi:MAG: sugar phosphate nucleotidyltransferase [Nocardioidaceae bacterium]
MSRTRPLVVILAGGAGGRLELLTRRRAKPAVPFAGTHRLIDFPLSNCHNSGLTDVWVSQQFNPFSLSDHLSNGRPWDLDRTTGGLLLLQPRLGHDERGGFQQGTADGLWRFAPLIREFAPDVLVVVSADAVYTCDYAELVAEHVESGAKATIVTTEVAQDDAGRYGVVQAVEGRVREYVYKPEEPVGNLVSNEVFVFHPASLLDTLDELAEEAGDESLEDLGHELLPRLVEQGGARERRMTGYWRDVGTIDAYWSCHQELLGGDPPVDLDDPRWPILTRAGARRAPARVLDGARVESSLLAPGARVAGEVRRSVVGRGALVERGAAVIESVLLPGSVVRSGARVVRAILDDAVEVGSGASIGAPDGDIALVGLRAGVAGGARHAGGARFPDEGWAARWRARPARGSFPSQVLKRTIRELPEHIFPPDEWRIVEARYSDRYFHRAETIFALSNGYVGIRGTLEEGRPAGSPGAFVSGFHETWPIVHAENAYGLARTGQTIVNVPDATIFRLFVEDEPLFLPTARLRRYSRVLDMRDGTLRRELAWATPAGRRVVVRSCRLVSLEARHVAAMTYEIVLPYDSAPVVICSQFANRQDARGGDGPREAGLGDPRLATSLRHRVLDPQVVEDEGGRMLVGYRTTNSGMTLGLGIEHVVETSSNHRTSTSLDGDAGELELTVDAQRGVPIRITKFVTYQSSRAAASGELVDRCRRTLDRVVRDGFESLLERQRVQLGWFWDRADVRVEAGPESERIQQAIRWNLFQVGQATWRAEGAGVPSKGLTGQAYEGQYFWDTEIYVLPFLAYTQPRIARNLLRFRHSMLARARERAREMSQCGAMFPWRTINGEEASANYQAGTAQYHINADIAYAIRRYVNVRGDLDFLVEVGAELLVETARLWEDLGFYADDGGFHIHGVTGPDEYTTVVNDNTFTNLMARLNLRYAAASVRRLQTERPEAYAALVEEVGLRSSEVESWERAAAAMHVPYDERRGIHPQDASFLEREVWDLERTPAERFPLLLHYHPLFIYRHQVIKQADVVLAMFLLGNEFSPDEKRANFDYYDALTTGDSSLSACVQSIVAAELGDDARALQYFRYALMMDLADVAGNVSDGVHIASAAGLWQSLVYGFGGVRDFDGRLSITPHLPAGWDSLAFSLRFRNRQLRVHLAGREERYLLEEGEPLELDVRGTPHRLSAGRPLVLDRAAGLAEPSRVPARSR